MAETKVIQSTAASPQERARLRLTSVGPVINQMMAEQQAKQAKKEAAPVAPQAAEPEKSGLPADPKDWSMKDLLESKPLPEDIDPFSRTLLGGVDPIAVHQAMTVVIPILCQLGEQSRVLYSPHRLRWMCGMSWQMGVSGSGKSEVQRELEKLFLSKDLKENSMNAKEASKYSLLSEKEKKETPVPEEKVRIFMGLPTSLALVQQMQVNDGGAIYISCTECGEFGKKIAQTSYNAIPDMMKRSYDGTGEEYIHKTLQGSLYVPSMKLNANFSGTIDPVFKVFRYNNADGTLSRCNLTILPKRKDEEKEGVYKDLTTNSTKMKNLMKLMSAMRSLKSTDSERTKTMSLLCKTSKTVFTLNNATRPSAFLKFLSWEEILRNIWSRLGTWLRTVVAELTRGLWASLTCCLLLTVSPLFGIVAAVRYITEKHGRLKIVSY